MSIDKKESDDLLGLNLSPGDDHYRAYVGPPRDYDYVSAMVFNLLTCLGLRQDHTVLDIGCGSLRCGRILIPYLNKGNYFGVEPNKWLVDEGVKNEIGGDLVRIKSPNFSYSDSLDEFDNETKFDFVFAQSIFSHCGKDLISGWFKQVDSKVKEEGMFLFTFLVSEEDYQEAGWVYPACVNYKATSIEEIANQFGFNFSLLNWYHPRQVWACASKKEHSIDFENLSWGKTFE